VVKNTIPVVSFTNCLYICRHGFPRVLISDQGTEFRNKFLEEVCRKGAIDHRRTAPYHPQCNGLTERFNRTLKNQLLKATPQLKNWDEKLDECVFAYRTAKQSSTGFTPFRLFYRRYGHSQILNIPLSIFIDSQMPVYFLELSYSPS